MRRNSCHTLLLTSRTTIRPAEIARRQPGSYEPDGYGHAVQIVQVCTGHREVTFRRSQSPALDTKLQISQRSGTQSQPSWSSSALCLLSSHTPQSRRSHRAATDPRPRELRDRTQHHVAGSVSVRWRTLWKSGGRPCTVQYPMAFASEGGSMVSVATRSPFAPIQQSHLLPGWNVLGELTRVKLAACQCRTLLT